MKQIRTMDCCCANYNNDASKKTHAAASPRTLLRGLCIWAILFLIGATAYATTVPPSIIPHSLNTKVVTNPIVQHPSSTRSPQNSPAPPLWSGLTLAQQQALAPLSTEWDKLDGLHKNKWLAIGNKFASMKPEEQRRVQERMRDWVKLTPEQRRTIRENYARAKKLNKEQKSAQWQQYQQLPEEQKKKLAADATPKKHITHVTNLPPSSQGKNRSIAPIKSTPKLVLEQSVTPQAASQSGLAPLPPPASEK